MFKTKEQLLIYTNFNLIQMHKAPISTTSGGGPGGGLGVGLPE
jgi:hypothetical protein